MIARFIRFYGHDFYHNERWPTRDKIIPHRLFWQMHNASRHVAAGEQLKTALAVGHGTAMVNAGKKGQPKVRQQTRILVRESNPEAL